MAKEPDLAALITKRKGDRSFRQLAVDCGGRISANRIQQIATQELRSFPDPDTIRALARGLSTTVTEVTLAAARSLGLRVATHDPEALIVADAGNLPQPAQDLILSMSRKLMEMVAGLETHAHPGLSLIPGGLTEKETETILSERYREHAAYVASEREDTKPGE